MGNSQKFARLREIRKQKRVHSPAPDYPVELPFLRRRIIIINYDFGEETHILDCYRSNRIDCFRVEVDGKQWEKRIGFSRILAGIRKALPRVQSL